MSDNNDPWKRRNETPPNIDQIIKNIFGSFKKGSGNGGNSSDSFIPEFSMRYVIYFILGLVVVYFALGFYSVQESEQAVVTRLGKYNRVDSAGLHWHFPLVESPKKVDINYIHTLQRGNNLMLTADQNIVMINSSLQYRYADAKAYLFNALTPILTLEELMDSATRHVIGHMHLDDILTTEKSQIAPRIKEIIDDALRSYDIGIQLSVVTLIEAKPPEDVQHAFDDVIRAKEDFNTLKNKALRYRESKIPEAKGYAKRLVEQSDAERERIILNAQGKIADFMAILPDYKKSPSITGTRLYIDAMRNIFSKTSKVVVDVDGGSLMYLPLQEILSKAGLDNDSSLENVNEDYDSDANNKSESKKFYSGKTLNNKLVRRGG